MTLFGYVVIALSVFPLVLHLSPIPRSNLKFEARVESRLKTRLTEVDREDLRDGVELYAAGFTNGVYMQSAVVAVTVTVLYLLGVR